MEKIGLSKEELLELIEKNAQNLVNQYPDQPKEDLILTLMAIAINKNNEKILEDLTYLK